MSQTSKAALIDGSNIYATTKALGIEVDYKLLLKSFGDDLVRCIYYTAVKPPEMLIDGNDPLRPLLDWLEYNGYSVVKKTLKEWVDPLSGISKIKGDMDPELIVDAMEMAHLVKEIHLFTGDGDYTYLVHALHRQGVRVVVYSTIKTSPAMCADELRRAADKFVDLGEVKEGWVRPKGVSSSPVRDAGPRYR